jgi:hypothetical protein
MDVLQRSPSRISLGSAFGKPFSPAEYDSADFFFFFQVVSIFNCGKFRSDNQRRRGPAIGSTGETEKTKLTFRGGVVGHLKIGTAELERHDVLKVGREVAARVALEDVVELCCVIGF